MEAFKELLFFINIIIFVFVKCFATKIPVELNCGTNTRFMSESIFITNMKFMIEKHFYKVFHCSETIF